MGEFRPMTPIEMAIYDTVLREVGNNFMSVMLRYVLPVGLISENTGGYSAYVINLPGVLSQGESEAEAEANVADALSGALAEYSSSGSLPPWEENDLKNGVIIRLIYNYTNF